MNATGIANLCGAVVLSLLLGLPGTSCATYISILGQSQHVSAYASSGTGANVKDRFGSGNGAINVETGASDEVGGESRGWITSSASQKANINFNNNGKFTVDLALSGGDFSVVNFPFPFADLTARGYSEYSLGFHINKATRYNISYGLGGFGGQALTFLVNSNTGNYLFNDVFPYNVVSDMNGEDPYSGKLDAGDYCLYMLADTGFNSCGENGTSFDSFIEAKFSVDAIPVPEPSTLVLLSAGLAGIGMFRFRNRKALNV